MNTNTENTTAPKRTGLRWDVGLPAIAALLVCVIWNAIESANLRQQLAESRAQAGRAMYQLESQSKFDNSVLCRAMFWGYSEGYAQIPLETFCQKAAHALGMTNAEVIISTNTEPETITNRLTKAFQRL